MSTDPTRVRPAPRWVAPLFAVLGVVTIPWTVYLGATLPDHARTHNYREAWVGFDIMLVVMLLATAYLAWRGRRSVALVATSTATMLVLDAWFDVLTSRREDMAGSVASAVLAEIPLAILCGWIALHADRVAERRLHQLTRRVARLQSSTAATSGTASTTGAAVADGLLVAESGLGPELAATVTAGTPSSLVAAGTVPATTGSAATTGPAATGDPGATRGEPVTAGRVVDQQGAQEAADHGVSTAAAAVQAAVTGKAVADVANQTAEIAAEAAEEQTRAAERNSRS